MGSTIVPMATFGNPTGAANPAIDPNYMAETMRNMQMMNPDFSKTGQQNALGNNGNSNAQPSSFLPQAPNPVSGVAPSINPAAPMLAPRTTTPGAAAPFILPPAPSTGTGITAAPTSPGTTQFGYPTANPGTGVDFSNLSVGVPPDVIQGMQHGATGRNWALTAAFPLIGGIFGGGHPAYNDLEKSLQKTYGKGTGSVLFALLANNRLFNPQIAQAFANDIQPYFQENLAQTMEYFGASGNRFSSNAALAGGKATADFTSHQQALFAQMWQTAMQEYLQVLLGTATKNTSGNIFGTITDALGLTSAGAAGLSAAGVGAGGGTAAAVLAGLAAI